MKNFVQPGITMTATLAVAVASGDYVRIGALNTVASGAYAAGEEGEYQLEGAFALTAQVSAVADQGAIAYWDTANKRVTDAAQGNTAIGHFFAVKANGQATAIVRLAQPLA